MSSPGGGKLEIEDLVRSHGADALRQELEAFGCAPDARRRLQCPFPGCSHKGKERDRDAELFPKGHPRVHCFACGERGDLLDILQLSRGLSRLEAIEHLRGAAAPPPVPQLRVVSSAPADDPDKLKPAQVLHIWNAMTVEDQVGEAYLEQRGLGDAIELGLVRFATEEHPDRGLKRQVSRGYRVAALLTDVVGNARGIQLRAVVRLPQGKPKILSVTGSATGSAFFGHPEHIEHEPIVAVAEGLADTLALAGWVGKHPGVTVVGAAGKSALPRLAEELEGAGIPVEGKYFALFPQNDQGVNGSRKEFKRLSQLLAQRGARVVWVATDSEFKDLADWLQARPDIEWPPAELRKAILPAPGDEAPKADRRILAPGTAVPIPGLVDTKVYAQNFTTLCALIDDPGSRADVLGGPGELTWCEMTQRPRFAGRQFGDTDYLAIRLALEAYARGTDGKPLKFSVEDISQAVTLLSRRKTVHPVREWLCSLTWDGHHRLDTEFPQALGQVVGGLDSTLLRRWMIAAVARAMTPGCKAENALVLVGPQGVGKSTFFEVLGGEWFTRDRVFVDDKDSKLVLRRAWIVEWSEMEALKRAKDLEAVKTFLSQSTDMYRPPYGREVIEVQRSSIFGGTTNNPEYLSSDPSGYRRFWTMTVKGMIDIPWLRQAREQLFAEAVVRFRAGEQWHLLPAEQDELDERNREFEAEHPWFQPIASWLDGEEMWFRDTITVADVFQECLKKDMDAWSSADARAVAGILERLRWTKTREASGKRRRVYARPGRST